MQSAILSRPRGAAMGQPLASGAPPRAPTLLRPVQAFSTASVESARQFDAWQAQCGSFLELTAPLNHQAGYRAHYIAWKLGPFLLTSVTAQAARYRRTRTQIRRDALDHWVIRLARRGVQRMWTATDSAVVPTDMPFVFSLSNALEGERSDLKWVSLIVPRDMFPGLASVMDRSLHMPLDSGLGLLLGRYLDALDTQARDMTEAELPRLVAATRSMVAACITPPPRDREAAAPLVEHVRLERVRRAVRQNLRSPTLTPKQLCRLVGMSRSQLYRLYEPTGGVARYIQAERLREAHRALADPDNPNGIHAVGENSGFFDASAFSRIFRREYGCTPSEVRAAALAGLGHIALRRPPEQATSCTFTAVLRALQ